MNDDFAEYTFSDAVYKQMQRNKLKPLIEAAWIETSPRLNNLLRDTPTGKTIKETCRGDWCRYLLIIYTDGTYTFIDDYYDEYGDPTWGVIPLSLRTANEHGLATEQDLQPIRELEARLAAV